MSARALVENYKSTTADDDEFGYGLAEDKLSSCLNL